MTTTLTAKQAAFVQEYLVDLNATQAAIRAGYSPKTANRMGAENLTKPVIAAAVRAAQADRAQRNELTTQVCAGRVELLVDKEERVIHKISFELPPGFTFAEPTADGAPVVARDEAAELRAAITDLLEGIQQHFDALDPFVEAIRDHAVEAIRDHAPESLLRHIEVSAPMVAARIRALKARMAEARRLAGGENEK